MFQASQRRAATRGVNRWLLLAGLGLLVLGLVLRMMLDIGAVGGTGTDSSAVRFAAVDTGATAVGRTAVGTAAEDTASVDTAAPPPASVPSPASPTPAPPTAAPAGAYVVQLGLFSRQSNAESIRSKVAALGYTATVHPLQRGARTLYRVSVDDIGTSEAAKQAADSLGRGLKIEGVVVSNRDGV